MIEAHELTRHFGARVAVDRLTFRVPKGEIVGFLGPNGAGKSTTLKMLSGYLAPTSGTARVDGHDIVDASLEARRKLGYMPESMPLHPEMRVEEYLRFRAEIKGVRDRNAAVAKAQQLADIADVSRRLIGELSKGYKQRVGLADALVSSPPLLILDEPTEGLDPNQILRFREVLKNLAGQHTILLSTHIMAEVEAVCARVIIIDRGRIAAEGPIDTVRAALQGDTRDLVLTIALRDRWAAWADDAKAAAAALFDGATGLTLRDVSAGDGLARVELTAARGDAGDVAVEALVAKCVAQGLGVRELTATPRSLERVFHELTSHEGAEAKPS